MAGDVQGTADPACDARGINNHARRDRASRGLYPANGIITFESVEHGAALAHINTQRARPLQQHRVKVRPPDLETLPCFACIAAERFKPARAGPLDPYALVARADDIAKTLRDAEPSEQRLDPGMHRLAGSVATGRCAFAQRYAKAPSRASDGSRAARRSAPDDDYVGIDRSTVHGPFSRWISTALPAT
jgi:hypothetical protein